MPKKITKKKGKTTTVYVCKHEGCKKPTVYMKRNQKTGKMEHWCAPHFKSDVEAKSPKKYKDKPRPAIEKAPPLKPVKVKRKVKK